MAHINGVYRNQPQLNFNTTLNDHATPNVPKFNSNAMDNDGLMPLNNSCNGRSCRCHHSKKHKENKNNK